ncbi:CPBP family glutamic-type intramembrane protease, partial [uncultured Muribaculum sp.]
YYWQKLQQKYFRFAVWGTAIAFGLIHLIAFTHYSLILVPYMLCVVTVPFAAGCTITYYRVNLGFWWGVAMHIFNNLPAIFVLLTI